MRFTLRTRNLPARLCCPSQRSFINRPVSQDRLRAAPRPASKFVTCQAAASTAWRRPEGFIRRASSCAARYLTTMQAATATAQADAAEAQIDNIDTKVPSTPTTIYRKDYKPTPYQVDDVHLTFQLHEDASVVMSRLKMRPNHNGGGGPPPIVFNGRDDMKLWSIAINGKQLASGDYKLDAKTLTILKPPSGNLEVEIQTRIKPQENTSLEGLYKSGGNYCSQCEAEGFRGITYFYDRPDVMSKYTTRIEADEKYPVLLSNGNLIDSGKLDNGRHFAVWEDPWKKPCYLFALVAGDLAMIEDTYKTKSGQNVKLRIYVQKKNLDKVDHAMVSLKKAMKWDEDTFGLEYDLELFNIVAVDDFNMGAMENKSLNVFNSRLVVASPQTATDLDFRRIEGVIGHEYFHNWTGNRVTCRDWFQLTLKEGLTVFRDQEFSSDMNSRPVKRIEDVSRLRTSQYTEDAGPMAHPIRPESYIKMDNFYTLTVYEKGAEVVRIYRNLLGKQGFRKGMDLYFKRHDGHAVTCDDFFAAMADANGEDLGALRNWYSQAGTPRLEVRGEYNDSAQTYTLHTKQSTASTPGQANKLPVLIPLAVGLLGPDGHELPLHLQGSKADVSTSVTLRVTKDEQSFTFTDVTSRPVPSLLRGFSAPVNMEVVGQSDEDLMFLLAHDSDAFSRWEAGQVLERKLIKKLYAAASDSKDKDLEDTLSAAGGVPSALVEGLRAVLNDESLDGTFRAAAVSLPANSELISLIPEADPVLVHSIRKWVVKQLAQQLRPDLEAQIKKNDAPAGDSYSPDFRSVSKRTLKNQALGMLASLKEPAITKDIMHRFQSATNMTDRLSALSALANLEVPERQQALDEFYELFKDDTLVVLKWLTQQTASNVPGNLQRVKALLDHPAFNMSNPNSCYSLFGGFFQSTVTFHAADGSGYQFLADSILKVDKINRTVAARLVGFMTNFRQFDKARQEMIKAQLDRIKNSPGLSENVFEIASKSLE